MNHGIIITNESNDHVNGYCISDNRLKAYKYR